MTTQFDNLAFVPHDADSALFRDRILRFVSESSTWRALEIGCGTGASTVAIAGRRGSMEIVACDISQRNIALAERSALEAGVNSTVKFVAANFLDSPEGQFDLIFVKSALYLMNCEDDVLARKLWANLKPGGVLICVEPYRCPKTLALILLRRALSLLPTPLLNWFALNIAKQLYNAPQHILSERLPYLRAIPRRLDGNIWRKRLAAAGLEMVLDEAWPSTSIAKLQHRLTLLRRPLRG